MFDEVFGQLKHKYNFYKYEPINLFGKDYKIKIVVEDDESNIILDIQRESYKKYKKYITENQEKIVNLIKQYFLDVYNANINIQIDIKPISIYFARDGSWGILFDTNLDEENGFAIFIKNSKLHIGTQDLFL